jgi:hypothetical protein
VNAGKLLQQGAPEPRAKSVVIDRRGKAFQHYGNSWFAAGSWGLHWADLSYPVLLVWEPEGLADKEEVLAA